MKHVVLAGNPVDGVSVWGPFDTADDAASWAGQFLKHEEHWAVELNEPKED
jgi:hypothetical protein